MTQAHIGAARRQRGPYVQHNLLLRGVDAIFPTHNKRVLGASRKPPLIEVTVVGGRDAPILWRCARLQFQGDLVQEWLNRLESSFGISILSIEVGCDPGILAVA